MRLQKIMHAIACEPWLITPTAYGTIRQIVENKLTNVRAEEDGDFWAVSRRSIEIDENGIAHIQVLGPIGKRLSKIEKSCGLTDVDDIGAEIRQAEMSARAIMLHVDSPGGTTTGVPEVARILGDAAIPVCAWTDTLAASAAYYLMVGADRIFASESADVGSIGVYIPWVDWEGWAEKMGISPNPVVSTGSSLKGIGLWPTLSDEHRAHLQDLVDQVNKNFRSHVTRFRAVDNDSMNGGTWFGEQALERNLVDEIGTYETAYGWLLGQLI
jgi:signal peptide peptidase SppA